MLLNHLHHASFAISLLGVLVILCGVLRGLSRFVRIEFRAARGGETEAERCRLRHTLGFHLLLGLEFLVAADLIDSLMKPHVQELASLGVIFVIRTVTSYSLVWELKTEPKPVVK